MKHHVSTEQIYEHGLQFYKNQADNLSEKFDI